MVGGGSYVDSRRAGSMIYDSMLMRCVSECLVGSTSRSDVGPRDIFRTVELFSRRPAWSGRILLNNRYYKDYIKSETKGRRMQSKLQMYCVTMSQIDYHTPRLVNPPWSAVALEMTFGAESSLYGISQLRSQRYKGER